MAKEGEFNNVFGEKTITPKGVASFPYIGEPHTSGRYADNKFKVRLLLDKETSDMDALKEALASTAKEAFGESVNVKQIIADTIRDGDRTADKYPEQKGCWVINAKSKARPGVCDLKGNNLDGKEIYGGSIVRISVTPMSYTTSEKVRNAEGILEMVETQGVTFLLKAVLKVSEGERIGGSSAQSDFGAFIADKDNAGAEASQEDF